MNRAPSAAPKTWRAWWWTVAAALTVVGTACGWLALRPAGALLLLGTVAGLVAVGCWQLRPPPDRPRPSATDVTYGLVGGTATVAVIGLTAGFGPAGGCVSILVAAAGWPVLRPPDRTRGRAGSPSRAGGPATCPGPAAEVLPPARLPEPSTLSSVSTPALCSAWRISYVLTQRCTWASDRARLAELRAAYLAELEHRDPAAFARWFPTARAASDPARYFLPRASHPGTAAEAG